MADVHRQPRGTLLLAGMTTRLTEMVAPTRFWRFLLGTGFCGALTTFSTFQIETIRLARDAGVPLAAGYALGEPAAGLALAVARDRGGAEAPLRMIAALALAGIAALGAAGAYARFRGRHAGRCPAPRRVSRRDLRGQPDRRVRSRAARRACSVTGDALLVLGTGLLGAYTMFSTCMVEGAVVRGGRGPCPDGLADLAPGR